MIRRLSKLRRKLTAVRLLQTTLVAVTAFFISSFMPLAAQAAPQHTTPFMGENPSGKTKRDGSPLHRSYWPSKPGGSKKHHDDGNTFSAECPKEIKCVVVPAAYASNNNDPADYGNYDKADRPHDMKINSIVLHDTEGTLDSVKQAFQDPSFYASAHYVIDTDGTVYQFVPTKDVAWHAGNWTTNEHSIGIEHVGYSAEGSSGYTPAMYRSSEALVNWLAKKYDISRDRQHIIGHDNVQAPNPSLVSDMHVDPGPYWNWQGYMAQLSGNDNWQHSSSNSSKMQAPKSKNSWDKGDWNRNGWNKDNWKDWISKVAVTIRPQWDQNKQTVTGCSGDKCVPTDPQSTNFVYLHTEPNNDAPLVSDTVLGQGTTDVSNTSAKAFYGQTFAIQSAKIDQDGVWYEILFGGQNAWVYSPWNAPTAMPTLSKYVTPKAGKDSVPLYGRPVPEKSDYPDDFTPAEGDVTYPTPLQYSVAAGQRYEVMGAPVRADNFYAQTIDKSQGKYDHKVFKGKELYVPVQYNNRFGYVKLSDVDMK